MDSAASLRGVCNREERYYWCSGSFIDDDSHVHAERMKILEGLIKQLQIQMCTRFQSSDLGMLLLL